MIRDILRALAEALLPVPRRRPAPRLRFTRAEPLYLVCGRQEWAREFASLHRLEPGTWRHVREVRQLQAADRGFRYCYLGAVARDPLERATLRATLRAREAVEVDPSDLSAAP